tara:strand:+ start:199 stop:744 length:546 start_codon:yes stop_codon:yes gene_type:complete
MGTEYRVEGYTDGGTPYTLHLTEYTWGGEDDGDYEVIGEWNYDGQWHGSGPLPHDHDDEGEISRVEETWDDEEAPWLAVEAVMDTLERDLAMTTTGFSSKSEAKYLTHEDSWGRVRVATHEPVYESSREAFNILIGQETHGRTGMLGGIYYLPLHFTQAQLDDAIKHAADWLEETAEDEDW